MRQAVLPAAPAVLASSVLVFVMASPAWLRAQEAAGGAVFPAHSQAVTVDVVVLDAQGRPVKDLTRADFIVKEDGTPRDLVAFRAVTPGASGPSPTKSEPTSIATNDDARPERGRIFLAVFDDLHLTPIEAERAQAALYKFLDTNVHVGDHVTLLATSGGTRRSARLPEGMASLHGWVSARKGLRMPDDPRARISAWEAYRVYMGNDDNLTAEIARRLREVGLIADNMDPEHYLSQFGLGESGPRAHLHQKDSKAALVRAQAGLVYAAAATHAQAVLGSLRDALDSLSVAQGRKTVLFISEGFFRDPTEPLYLGVIDAARRANAVVDFLDARELTGLPDNTSVEMERVTQPHDHAVYERDLHDAEGAESVAIDTGGFVLHGRLEDGLNRAARESESYYLLGYEPPWTRADGRFHKIEVEVARPGVRVQARRGYHATAASPSTGGLHPDVAHALDSPLEASGIPVRLAAYVLGPTDGGKSLVVLAGAADGAQLGWEEAGGRFGDGLETVFRVTPAAGEGQPTDQERRLELKLSPEEHATVVAEGVPLLADFDLAPGRHLARLVVRDERTGRLGSVLQEIDVPGSGFRLSTPILTDTVHADGGGAPTPIPLARRTFKTGTKLYCSFQALGAADAPDRPPRVSLEIAVFHADGSVLVRSPSQVLPAGPRGELERMLAISLDQARPGEYQLVLRVRDEDTGRVAEQREPFTVAGTGASAASVPTYRDLVAAYAHGAATTSVSGLQGLEPERVRREARSLRASASCDSRCLEAAVLMHTDAAVAAAGRGGDVDFQLSVSRDLLGGLPDGPLRRAWQRAWLLAAGYVLEGQARFPEALRTFDDAARLSRDDAEVLLAQGTVAEALSLLPDLVPSAEAYPAHSPMERQLLDRSVRDRYEAQALTLYERALAGEPGLLEARLRRGRILGLQGRATEAAADLEAVARGAKEPYLRSLASLFLGDVEERRGRLEPGAESYRAALAASPGSQTARVALASVLRRLGRNEAAALAIEQGLKGVAAQAEDPWVGYHLGLAWRRDAALERLKAGLGK